MAEIQQKQQNKNIGDGTGAALPKRCLSCLHAMDESLILFIRIALFILLSFRGSSYGCSYQQGRLKPM